MEKLKLTFILNLYVLTVHLLLEHLSKQQLIPKISGKSVNSTFIHMEMLDELKMVPVGFLHANMG
jgi:hypothetical protein